MWARAAAAGPETGETVVASAKDSRLHDNRVAVAKSAIDDVFGSTRVAPDQTRNALCDIRDHVEGLLDMLNVDLRRERVRG